MNSLKSAIIPLVLLSLLTITTVKCGYAKEYTLSYSPGTLFHQLVRDKAKLVYEKAGLPAAFIQLPHNRSLISANEGSVDGDVGRVPSVEDKFPNLVRVEPKLMDLNGAAYTYRDDIQAYDDALLAQYRIGYVLGVRWTEKKMRGLKGIAARSYEALFEMLLQKRVDVILATEASAEHVMSQLGEQVGTIIKLQPYVLKLPIYHYVNKKNKDIIPQLEQAISILRKEGKL